MAAVTLLGLVVLVSHGMTVPATPSLPGAMGMADFPSPSVRGGGQGGSSVSKDGTGPDPKDGRTLVEGEGGSFGVSLGSPKDGASTGQEKGRKQVAQRNRLGSRAAWRSHNKNDRNNNNNNERRMNKGTVHDDKPTSPLLRGGGRDEHKIDTTVNKDKTPNQKAAATPSVVGGGGNGGGGASAGGGSGVGGGGSTTKKRPPRTEPLSAAKQLGAAANEEIEAQLRLIDFMEEQDAREGGGKHASEVEEVAVVPRRDLSHAAQATDVEEIAVQAVLATISGKGNAGRQQRRGKATRRRRPFIGPATDASPLVGPATVNK